MPTLALEPARSFPRAPHAVAAGEQDSLPSRYSWWVHVLALAGFTLAFVGWLNETWLFLFESPIWLNRYTEYAIILAFGLWRIAPRRTPTRGAGWSSWSASSPACGGCALALPLRRAPCWLPLVAAGVPRRCTRRAP
jgi:hypothetical protein